MKDFSQVNQALQELVNAYPADLLSGISNTVSRVGQRVYNGVNEYSMLYAQQQLLKYDSEGDPEDVTTQDRLSIAEAALANCKRESTELLNAYRIQLDQLPPVRKTEVVRITIDSQEQILWFSALIVRDTRLVSGYAHTLGILRVGLRVGENPGFVLGYVEVDPESNMDSLIPYRGHPVLGLISRYMFPTVYRARSTSPSDRHGLSFPGRFKYTLDSYTSYGVTATLVPIGVAADGHFTYRVVVIGGNAENNRSQYIQSGLIEPFRGYSAQQREFTLDELWETIKRSATGYQYVSELGTSTPGIAYEGNVTDDVGSVVLVKNADQSGVLDPRQEALIELTGRNIPDQSDAIQNIIDLM